MQVVTTSQIVETLLTKGELVLPDFGEGNRIKIQQHMYQAKKTPRETRYGCDARVRWLLY